MEYIFFYETGNIDDVYYTFCEKQDSCDVCEIDKMTPRDDCLKWVRQHPVEAAEIMGWRCRVNVSEDSKALLELYRRQYPGVAYVARSRGDNVRNPGALRLHWTMPEVTDGGFAPTGRFVELAPELLPEVPEGVMMKIDTLLAQDVTARRAEDSSCEEVAE